MNSTTISAATSAAQVRQIEKICDRFEAAWQAGNRPSLENFLSEAPASLHSALLKHLVALDWEYRTQAGEQPGAGEYKERFSSAGAAIDAAIREIMGPDSSGGSVPRQLGAYRILRQVGRGGMGVVYEAVREPDGRRVAVKMLPWLDPADPDARERFWREAHTTARLDHPNIVQIFEVGEQDGQLFLVLEFVPGPSLSDRIRDTPQPPRQAAALVETLARAVQHAHDQGIVHRDLKPANVLLQLPEVGGGSRRSEVRGQMSVSHSDLRSPTSDLVPKITDFGLAQRVGASELTATGDILGTPGYMAPEQAWGKSKQRLIGPAADVYALGAVLYAALTGRPPFRGTNALEALEQVRFQDPVPPSRLQPNVPRELETICLKCLEKEPGQRYASAALLAEDLRRYLAGQSIKARRISSMRRMARWCRRNPAPAAAGVLGVVALLAAVGLVISQAFTLQLRHEQQLTQKALNEAELQRARATQNARQLAQQQELTKAALVEAQQFRGQAERLSVNLELERGLTLLEQDDIGRGMLVLGNALQRAPAEASDLAHVIRMNLAAARSQHPYQLASILDHHGEVDSAVFSPDGTVLLTGGRVSGARRWNAATGDPIGDRVPHEGEIKAVAYSADGKVIATAGTDETVRLWDAATLQPIGKPLQHNNWVLCVAISPDGKTAFTGSADAMARLWDVKTGELRGELKPGGWVHAVAFSPNGQTLATGSGNAARLWRTDTLEPLCDLLSHQAEVSTVAFSPDGRVLATGGGDGTVRLWQADTGKPLGHPLAHHKAVRSVSYSRDGQVLLTAGVDGRIHFWDAAKLRPLQPPVCHQTAVYAAALSPDRSRLATGGTDGKVRLWEHPPAASAGVVLPHDRLVYCAAFSPDGKLIATGTADSNVRLWNAETGEMVGQPLAHGAAVFRVAFSPDGQSLATACMDKIARVWNVADGTSREIVLSHADHVYTVAYSPNGRAILTGAKDSTARLWDAATGEPFCAPLQHAGWVHAAAFSPDGRTILTGCEDGTAQVWSAVDGTPIGPPLLHRGPVRAVAFSPDSRMLLTGSWEDGTARLWDAATGKPFGPPLTHQEHVLAVAFSPDGKTVATGAWDGTARLWDVATGKRLGPPLANELSIRDVAFSPDGKTLLTASFDRTARVWQLPTAVEGDAQQITAWIQSLTGLELDADGLFRDLDADAWQKRRQKANDH